MVFRKIYVYDYECGRWFDDIGAYSLLYIGV